MNMRLRTNRKNEKLESPLGFEDQVRNARRSAFVVVLTCIFYWSELDVYTSSFWSWIRVQWWFKHDSFEPVWATLSFTLWINVFFLIDWLGQSYAHKYLINPIGRKPIQIYQECLHRTVSVAYLAPLLIFDHFYPRRQLPENAPGFFQMVFGVIAAIWLYDLIFYPVHCLLHKVPWLYKAFHSTHHANTPCVSEDIIRHSLVDGTLQVLANILALNTLRLHPLTRMAYNFVITYLLTESHAGYDMPWMLHNIVPGKILGGPNRHEMHHRTGRKNFHQFFTYLDDYFGFGIEFHRD
mmetsp:Transcript_36064/g.44860  ORF Transcript_36064/g.44860 Transcript_36064/m.44860 type:complete len:295 (+) Transcript_36064:191-1075(+)